MRYPAFLFLLTAITAGPHLVFANGHDHGHDHENQYDYIIVGGGTTGLVVANRLSEDPQATILVVEAGESGLNNPNVTDPKRFLAAMDTPLDWAYKVTGPQWGGRDITLRSGRALGGSSAINAMIYLRPNKQEVDNWHRLGNRGWTWRNLFPYFLKSENITAPPLSNKVPSSISAQGLDALPLPYQPAFHGTHGPVRIGFVNATSEQTNPNTETDLWPALTTTLNKMGIPSNPDINSGQLHGVGRAAWTVDTETNIRSDAASAYYWPYHQDRKNLHIQLGSLVTRIIWDESTETATELATAAAVEIRTRTGEVRIARARKEIILAAGAIGTPAILERSGVGNPAILDKYKIPVRVDLPAVGENLHDRMSGFLTVSVTSKGPVTGSVPVAYVIASELFGADKVAELGKSLWDKIPGYAERVIADSHGVLDGDEIRRRYEMQHRLIFGESPIPIAEILFRMNRKAPNTIEANFLNQVPFSRGSVHIVSADVGVMPAVKMDFAMADWDIVVQVAMARFVRAVFRNLERFEVDETSPGVSAVPWDASDEVWDAWLSQHYVSSSHVAGTAAMGPRSRGGVIDAQMKVYGTANVRVVDAASHPLLLSGHPISSLYASAERVSDIIKGEVQGDGRGAFFPYLGVAVALIIGWVIMNR